MKSNSPTAIVLCTDGVEEIELISITDCLRRSGIPTHIVSCKKDKHIRGLNDISLVADKTFDEIKNTEFECIIIPGGKIESLATSPDLIELIRKHLKSNKLLVASGSAPLVLLEKNGLLEGIDATCDPKISSQLKNKNRCQERIVVCGNIITSQGPGTATELALTICEKLNPSDTSKVQKLVTDLCIDTSSMKGISGKGWTGTSGTTGFGSTKV